MNDHPILYNPILAAANRANFDSENPIVKTQTRRVSGLQRVNKTPSEWTFLKTGYNPIKKCFTAIFQHRSESTIIQLDCPYGRPLDLLWVRENWRLKGWSDDLQKMLVEFKGNHKSWVESFDPSGDDNWMVNQIENLTSKGIVVPDEDSESLVFKKEPSWKPSIHMPKSAAQQWLLIKNIRNERLCDISESDSIQEGIQVKKLPFLDETYSLYRNYENQDFDVTKSFKQISKEGYPYFYSPISSFRSLIEKVQYEEVWIENPWVWVVEYLPISQDGRPSQDKIDGALAALVDVEGIEEYKKGAQV